MYIAVCDDHNNELEFIVGLLEQWQKDRHISLRYKAFQTSTELLNAAKRELFSLYLLDVIMPGTDGIAAGREIRSFDETADIVFLTSSPDFAYASYNVHALDYLLKPIRPDDLFSVLNRVAQRENAPPDDLLLKCGTTLTRIPFSQIVYVEVLNKCLYYHLADRSVKKVSGALMQCEPLLLARPEFRKIHRSYIVNLLHVSELSHTAVKTVSGAELPISRGLYKELQQDFVRLLFSKGERL